MPAKGNQAGVDRGAPVARVVAVVVGLLLAGCQASQRHATTQAAVPRESNAELVQYLADQPLVTAEPAYRAIYLLAHAEPFAGDFGELVEALQAERLVGNWSHEAARPLNRGDVGYMVCRACGIRTGINWNLTHLGRYAWRELVYHRIASGGGEWGLMSGGEFVGLLGRSEEYLRRTGRRAEQVELGSSADRP